jgi:hypothetical protein
MDPFLPELSVPGPADLVQYPVGRGGQPGDLRVPIDWKQNPHLSRSWQMWLHCWHFMAPLLSGYARAQSDSLLRISSDIALDWVRQHGKDAKASQFAWYDMSVASRAAFLGYLLSAPSRVLSGKERRTLTASAEEHVRWLSNQKNYKPRHNHGLFSDTGLLMLCKQVPDLKGCADAAPLAHDRFRETLDATVGVEGVHHEHSTAYHFDVLDLTGRKLAVDPDPEVEKIRDAMRASAPWFLLPDGSYAQLGDSHGFRGPDWALSRAAEQFGARLFAREGYYAVREADSYLLVSAAHHSSAHKQLDDLSFVLAEGGRNYLVDPGLFGYEKRPMRSYMRSAAAHNTFVIDGHHVLPSAPYQSALVAAGEVDGWYAVWAESPVAPASMRHERVWLYAPREVLVVLDLVESKDGRDHDHVRYLHFAPELQVETTPRGALVRSANGEALMSVTDASRTAPTRVDHFRGRLDPSPHGFVSPSDLTVVPASVIELWARSGTGEFVTVMDLTPREESPVSVAKAADGALKVSVGSSDLVLRRSEGRIPMQLVRDGCEPGGFSRTCR